MEEKKEFDQYKYQNEFNKNQYDRITVLTPKGMKEDVKKAAASQGMSTSAFILEAIKEKIATIEHS